MATNEAIQELTVEVEKFGKFEEDRLLERPDEWGDFNFKSSGSDIKRVLRIGRELQDLPLHDLPDGIAHNMGMLLRNVTETLTRIDEFNIADTVQAPNVFKEEVTSALHGYMEQFLTDVGLWFVYLKVTAHSDKDAQIEVQNMRSQAQVLLKELEEAKSSTLNEAESILQSARQAASESGVATHAEHYAAEVEDLKTPARIWLGIAGGLFAALLVFLGVFMYGVLADAGNAVVTPTTLAKLSAAVVLGTATLWCGRMYKATEHRRAVNRHKELALKTFRSFVDATTDKQTKDAVLLTTTHSIFDNVLTGLIDEKASTREHPALQQVVELGSSLSKAASRD